MGVPLSLTAIQNYIVNSFFKPRLFIFLGLVLIIAIITLVLRIAYRKWAERYAYELTRNLAATASQLKEAERFGKFGSFTWNFAEGRGQWSEEMFHLFGLVPVRKPPTIDKLISLIHEQDRTEAAAVWQRAQTQPGIFSLSFRVVNPTTREIRHIRIEGVTKLNADHGPALIQGVARDSSKEVEIDREKSEFVSLASHQLKSPLASIALLADTLLVGTKGELQADQKRYVGDIKEITRQMMEMVNDLLSVSRIELGTMVVEPEEINAVEFAEFMIKEQYAFAKQKNVTVTLKAQKDLPRVFADKNLMRMILQNVLSNAIKYSNPDSTVVCDLSHGTSESIFIRVTDTGIGIPKDELDKIFEKLHRARNAKALVPDGTGLGLYLIKTIVDRVHGGITLESVEGKGTTVYVTIPAKWERSIQE